MLKRVPGCRPATFWFDQRQIVFDLMHYFSYGLLDIILVSESQGEDRYYLSMEKQILNRVSSFSQTPKPSRCVFKFHFQYTISKRNERHFRNDTTLHIINYIPIPVQNRKKLIIQRRKLLLLYKNWKICLHKFIFSD